MQTPPKSGFICAVWAPRENNVEVTRIRLTAPGDEYIATRIIRGG